MDEVDAAVAGAARCHWRSSSGGGPGDRRERGEACRREGWPERREGYSVGEGPPRTCPHAPARRELDHRVTRARRSGASSTVEPRAVGEAGGTAGRAPRRATSEECAMPLRRGGDDERLKAESRRSSPARGRRPREPFLAGAVLPPDPFGDDVRIDSSMRDERFSRKKRLTGGRPRSGRGCLRQQCSCIAPRIRGTGGRRDVIRKSASAQAAASAEREACLEALDARGDRHAIEVAERVEPRWSGAALGAEPARTGGWSRRRAARASRDRAVDRADRASRKGLPPRRRACAISLPDVHEDLALNTAVVVVLPERSRRCRGEATPTTGIDTDVAVSEALM